MELGFAPRLLQSRGLGRLGKSISPAEPVVSSASRVLPRPSRLRRKLGLSSTELSPAQRPSDYSPEQTLGTWQSSWRQQTHSSG